MGKIEESIDHVKVLIQFWKNSQGLIKSFQFKRLFYTVLKKYLTNYFHFLIHF